jgi:small subunit ribosomal protein S6
MGKQVFLRDRSIFRENSLLPMAPHAAAADSVRAPPVVHFGCSPHPPKDARVPGCATHPQGRGEEVNETNVRVVHDREYEVGVVLKPTLTDEDVQEFVRTFHGHIEAAGGRDVKVDRWGKRRLAYEIQHFHEGIYVFFRFFAPPSAPEALKHHLLIADAVIRHIIVLAPLKQEAGAEAVKPPRTEGSFRAPSQVETSSERAVPQES